MLPSILILSTEKISVTRMECEIKYNEKYKNLKVAPVTDMSMWRNEGVVRKVLSMRG